MDFDQQFAAQADKRNAMRAHLNTHRATLPLFDSPQMVRDLESAYMRMLEQWINGQPAYGFDVRSQ